MVQSYRRATVAQIAGSDRKVSEYTVQYSLVRMGLHSHRPVRGPMLTPVHCRKRQKWARDHQNWITLMAGRVCIAYLEHMTLGCTIAGVRNLWPPGSIQPMILLGPARKAIHKYIHKKII